MSRTSETPKDFDHTIVSTFGCTAAPPVRLLFLHHPGPRLSLPQTPSPPAPQTRLCVILFQIPQCLVHCTLTCPLLRIRRRHPGRHCRAAQVHLVDDIRTPSLGINDSPSHFIRSLSHYSALTRTRIHPRLSSSPPFLSLHTTRSGTRAILQHLAFLQDRVVGLTCRNPKRRSTSLLHEVDENRFLLVFVIFFSFPLRLILRPL